MSAEQQKVLFIVQSRPIPEGKTEIPLTPGEEAIRIQLGRAPHNYHVEVRGYSVIKVDIDADGVSNADVKISGNATALDVRDKALVIISSTVKQYAAHLCAELRDVAVPVIVSSKELYVGMQMCGSQDGDSGSAKDQQQVDIVHSNHPMMAGLSETVEFCGAEMDFDWVALPSKDPIKIGSVKGDANKVVLFAHRTDTPRAGAPDPIPPDCPRFPARRVGFPFDYEFSEVEIAQLGGKYKFWQLFDAAVEWAVGKINIRQFEEVFKEEWQEIHRRRVEHYGDDPEKNVTGFDGKNAPENLVGLAMSGGGIRSATFCLGVLQGLEEFKLLRAFDYFSTVSGGGYLGGWWSAWLSRQEGKKKNQGSEEKANDKKNRKVSIFPKPENIEPERLEDYRWRTGSAKVAEGSLSAGKDPIHHLRLFANYLTPRKGGLSSDTWRAVSVITRNLLLTWLILLPIVLAFVILMQSYFMVQPNARNKFFHSHWSQLEAKVEERETAAKAITDDAGRKKFDQETEKILGGIREEYAAKMWNRASLVGLPLLPLVGWIGLMFLAYMRSNAALPVLVKIKDVVFSNRSKKINWKFRGTAAAHLLSVAAVGVLVFYVLTLAWPPIARSTGDALAGLRSLFLQWKWWIIGWAAIGLILLLYTLPWRTLDEEASEDNKIEDELRRGVWRNRIIAVHSKLLVTLCLLAVALVFAAYGHEIFDYLLRDPRPQKAFLDYVAKIGGWGVFVAAIFGMIFTALKSAPTGGHDSGATKQPPAWQRFIFAATPLLVMIALLIIAAWTAHELSRHLIDPNEYPNPWPLTTITFIGVALSLFFAVYEVHWIAERLGRTILICLIGSLLIIGAAVWFYFYRLPDSGFTHAQQVAFLRLAVVVGSLLFYRFMLRGNRWSGGWKRFNVVGRKKKPSSKTKKEENEEKADKRNAALLLGVVTLLLIVLGWLLSGLLGTTVSEYAALTLAAATGLILNIFYVVVEVFLAQGNNRRSLVLLASAYFVLVALLLISFFSDSASRLQFVSLSLVAGTTTWVIALGWMADPNTLSMHSFYMGRIVRAYLGASNPQRRGKQYEITETIVGDDVLLTDLKNCERGAPYHLLNTTLNLIGGRDLATAQRSSAMFVLSKLYCGSFRTGFQRSTGYMDGRLSLGTAVATSGAAVSPGMGSGKTTASLAMLMTLLNVRLGFWVPTPSGEQWQSPQARLWPFYTLREFLSQTNDLSSYCYLTDGGHFDNLGIYSLVERGCRYIVIVDAVADPEPCFSDLGNAIRRCRIDFDADIDLDITPFVKPSKDNAFAKEHFVVGQITYSEKHVQKLKWEKTTTEDRKGIIIYLKTSLLKNEKKLRADVRQYGIENSDFPQQSTVDQWFDEAQFESYRRLGQHTVHQAFGKIEEDPNQKRREELEKKREATHRLSDSETKTLEKLRQEHEMLQCFGRGLQNGGEIKPLSIEFVKGLFDFIKEQQPKPKKS